MMSAYSLTETREHAHELIDQLPKPQLSGLVHLLETMVESLSRSLSLVEVEEQEINAETAAELDRARTSLERGEGISHEEILREFSLAQ